jgi:hypothetical protein
MFQSVVSSVNTLTNWLSVSIPWYLIISIFVCIYIVFFNTVVKFAQGEFKKRREIIKDVDLFKKTHPYDGYKSTESNGVQTILHLKQKQYPDSYYDNLKKIVKSRNPKPFQVLVAFFCQILLFVLFLMYFNTWEVVGNSNYYYSVAVSLFGILMLSKTKWLLRVGLFLMVCYVYQQFGIATLLFVIIFNFYRILIKLLKKNTKNRIG